MTGQLRSYDFMKNVIFLCGSFLRVSDTCQGFLRWLWEPLVLVFNFFKKTYIYLFIVCVHAWIWTQAYHCRSENCLWELALLFSNVDPWDWTLVLVLVRKRLYSLVHLTRLTFFCYCHSVYFKIFLSWSAPKREASKYPAMIKQLTISLLLFL